ncbi:MAG: DNA-directed DNA polymerase [Candidatus Nanoarchaeia archaeon]|nr:DNA-directed DNA polymerase [Candidatus Nanoarchaeia archaeon]
MKVQFYPTDVDTIEYQGEQAIRIFGRTIDNKRICILDQTFKPYFWAIPKHAHKITQVKWDISDMNGVKEAQTVKKKILRQEIEAIKVTALDSKDVPTLRSEVKRHGSIKEVRESDVPFYRRYLIDKGIHTLNLCEVEGEELELNLDVELVMQAKTIKEVDDKPLDKPRTLSIDIETYNPQKIPREDKDPIVMIAFAGDDGFKKVITWKDFPKKPDYVEVLNSEEQMLERFKQVIQEYAPDYLVTYFGDGFDFPYISKRAKLHKVSLDINWDYTPLKVNVRHDIPTAKTKGLVHIDIFKFISRTMAGGLDTERYDLNSVAQELLGEGKTGAKVEELANVWDNQPERLKEFAEYNLQDTEITLKIFQKVLPGLNEFVRLVGQPIYEVCRMSYGQIVEWYLMRKAFLKDELAPDRPKSAEITGRLDQKFEGAFVFEPVPGIYENIAVFDFKSLYPTIIATHKLDSSTLSEKGVGTPAPETEISGKKVKFYFDEKKEAFIPEEIKELIEVKGRVSDQLKKDPENATLKGRRYALKVLANSVYGYLSFSGSKWYCIEAGASTAAYARQYIKNAMKEAEEQKFKVIYGDTDSLLIVLENKTKEDAIKFQKSINKNLPGLMELELEGIFPRGIFVGIKSGEKGAKKKYALLKDNGKIKITGFETIRGDWSILAKETQNELLNIILKENDKEKAIKYVKEIIQEVKTGKMPLEKMIISRQLRKDLSDYEAVGPHVAIAKKMQEKGIPVGPGTIIQFVVNEGNGIIRERAKLPEESTKYDVDYYLKNQVLPAVDPIMSVLGYTKKDLIEGNSQSTLGDY